MNVHEFNRFRSFFHDYFSFAANPYFLTTNRKGDNEVGILITAISAKDERVRFSARAKVWSSLMLRVNWLG